MKRTRGLSDLSHIGHSLGEDSDREETVREDTHFNMATGGTDVEAGASGRSEEETRVSKTDLASIISQNTRNNYSRVHGLKYYAGGHEKDPNDPTKPCLKSISKWLRDIDALTADNWTDLGKIQLAKQHALGAAFDLICVTVDNEGNKWEKVKERLKDVFPDEKTFFERKAELAASRRQTGETMPDFWVRLQKLHSALVKEQPESKRALQDDMLISYFTALPKHFQSSLTEEDMKKPDVVYAKSLKFIRNNPQLKLTQEDLIKEKRQVVAAVSSPSSSRPPSFRPPSKPAFTYCEE